MAHATTDLVRTQTTLRAGTSGKVYTVWDLMTDDAAATVEGAGYFNASRDQLGQGDVIRARMVLAGTAVLKQYIATSVPASGNVVVVLQTAAAG